jgi:predicted RNA-binding Zn ribbon-like protein
MHPLFLGSHPAVDFLNTAFAPQGTPIETIGDGRGFVDWLVAAGLLDRATASTLVRRFGIKALDASAEEARRVREWARRWLSRWRTAPRGDYRAEVNALNKLLEREAIRREVVTDGADLRVVERPRIEAANSLVGLVATQIAALVTQEQPSLLKRCAGSGCTLWFLDRTKAHRRLFCSTMACGNRAKVSAFRKRQRAG